MFERFTEGARQVVVFAQDEAQRLKHNYVGTEHLLLGLLREEEGLAARLLGSLGVTLDEVRAQVAHIIGQGDEVTAGQIPFTPRAKKVLELALREAQSLGHNYIGTEHLLIGLAHENEGVAARILLDFDVDGEKLRSEIIRMLSWPGWRTGSSLPPPEIVLESPPIGPEVAEEIERVRTEKEAAIEDGDFDRAAKLRDREGRLVLAAKQLTRAWRNEAESVPTHGPPMSASQSFGSPLPFDVSVFWAGVFLGAVAFPAGLLIGWLIWG